MTTSNPPCPHCRVTCTVKIGKNAAGTQRYKCPSCNKKFVENPQLGSKPIGDRPMTNPEHQKRWYDSLTPEEKSLHLEIKAIRRRELRQRKRNRGSSDDSDRDDC